MQNDDPNFTRPVSYIHTNNCDSTQGKDAPIGTFQCLILNIKGDMSKFVENSVKNFLYQLL